MTLPRSQPRPQIRSPISKRRKLDVSSDETLAEGTDSVTKPSTDSNINGTTLGPGNKNLRRRPTRGSAIVIAAVASTPLKKTIKPTGTKSEDSSTVLTEQNVNGNDTEVGHIDYSIMTIEELRDLEIKEKKHQLAKILAENDAKVRQLFHLEKFVSLVNYDPAMAKKDNSSVFELFRQRFDLWSKIVDSKTGGRVRTTRRQIHQQQKNVLGDLMNNMFTTSSTDTATPVLGPSIFKSTPNQRPVSSNTKNSVKYEDGEDTQASTMKPNSAPASNTRSSARVTAAKKNTSSKSSSSVVAPALEDRKRRSSRKSIDDTTVAPVGVSGGKSTQPSATGRKRRATATTTKVGTVPNITDKKKRKKLSYADTTVKIEPEKEQDGLSAGEDELYDNDNSETEMGDRYAYDYKNDSDYESDFDPEFALLEFGASIPKVKLNYRLPPPTITHPSHIAHSEFNNSLGNYLSSYVTLDDDMTKEELDNYVASQVELRQQIEQARLNGVLFDIEGETGGIGANKLKPYQDAERPVTHHDHLVSHALFFAKLMSEERKAHVSKAKKIATMIDLHSKRLKGADEKERKYEEKRIRQLARRTGQEVMKKWKLAEKVVLQRLAQRKQEEQRKEGKKQLNQILEKSALLLEARAADMTSTPLDTDHAREENEEDEDINSSGDEGDHIIGNVSVDTDPDISVEEKFEEDDFLSSGSEADEEHSDLDDIEDDNLTVEELKRKYRRLESMEIERDSDDEDDEEVEGDSEDEEGDSEDYEEEDGLGASLNTSTNEESNITTPDAQINIKHEGDKAPGHNLHEGNENKISDLEKSDDSDEDIPMDSEEDGTGGESESEKENDRSDILKKSGKVTGLAALFASGVDDSDDSDADVQFDQSGSDDGLSGSDETDESINMDSEDDVSSASDSDNELENNSLPGLDTLLGDTLVDDHDDEDNEDYELESEIKEENTADKLEVKEIKEDGQDGMLDDLPKEEDGVVQELFKEESVDDGTLETVERESRASRSAERDGPSTTTPFLLRGVLREYQHLGLDWLVGLYNSSTNGILADEMGLGKTIQTISLLSYLACEKEIWGPHLIVVPTSVMLNWEMEFKRFAPGFKVMTYYGSPAQRKEKRRGWNKENTWHICITSYQLVIQDQYAFRRKKWHYMILDEAHNIKNFRSQRWQALLNFNTERRLLLTGTPLQNNLIELWSLLYFLMPSSKASSMSMPDGFANLKDFQEWFARPVDKMVEGGEMADKEARATVQKLHQILRPYLLRRLKADVEKQMPAKYEHIVYCRLSKRQRYLYDDFMSRAQTKETLASGNFLSIINCLMQLRKVCNHPDLFEVRPIVTSLAIPRSVGADYEIKDLLIRRRLLNQQDNLDLNSCNLIISRNEDLSTFDVESMIKIQAHDQLDEECRLFRESIQGDDSKPDFTTIEGHANFRSKMKFKAILERTQHALYLSDLRSKRTPIYGCNVLRLCNSATKPDPPMIDDSKYDWTRNNLIAEVQISPKQRQESMIEVIDKFSFVTPPVVCLDMCKWIFQGLDNDTVDKIRNDNMEDDPFHQSQVKLSIAFPDKRLLQYDCGKLQRLAFLLQDLTAEGHRALIFTQMTKVLDILEQFLNIHGYRYLRLDGSTKIEQRQIMTERFNTDPKIPVFILSTRSGGLGINLTGADTVIFYDSDWNPSMDKQCQDRCHRIGQTRDVHIYRFVSEYTIESNILKKANQKSILDDVVIQEGEFTTDYFSKISVRDMLGDEVDDVIPADKLLLEENLSTKSIESALASAEDAEDSAAAKAAMREVNVDAEDFDENRARSMSVSRAVSQTPVPENDSTAEPEAILPTENDVDIDSEQAPREVSASINDDYEEEEEEEIGDIDDYMIRFIENGWFWDTR